MGNSNSFVKKQYEDSPWVVNRRTGNLLRLWAEVFKVTPSGTRSICWQQVSDDLVPVRITCVQESPHFCFRITAYNSKVDKILDENIIQPGTRLGQASACFIYWKNGTSGMTWGLNFTSPLDARQFREAVCGVSQEPVFSQTPGQNATAQRQEPTLSRPGSRAAGRPTGTPAPVAPAVAPEQAPGRPGDQQMRCTCVSRRQPVPNRAACQYPDKASDPHMATCSASVTNGAQQVGENTTTAQHYMHRSSAVCCDTVSCTNNTSAPRRDRLGKFSYPDSVNHDLADETANDSQRYPLSCRTLNKAVQSIQSLQQPDLIRVPSDMTVSRADRKPGISKIQCKNGKVSDSATTAYISGTDGFHTYQGASRLSNETHPVSGSCLTQDDRYCRTLGSYGAPHNKAQPQNDAGHYVDQSKAISGDDLSTRKSRRDRARDAQVLSANGTIQRQPRSRSAPRECSRVSKRSPLERQRTPSRCSNADSRFSPSVSPEVGRRHGPQSLSAVPNTFQPAVIPDSIVPTQQPRHHMSTARADGYMSEGESGTSFRTRPSPHNAVPSGSWTIARTGLISPMSSKNSEEDFNMDLEGGMPAMSEKVLYEYEQHLRSTLARGDNSESCSLRAFQSMMAGRRHNSGAGAGGGSRAACSPSPRMNVTKSLPRTVKPCWLNAKVATEHMKSPSSGVPTPDESSISHYCPSRSGRQGFDTLSPRSNSLGRRSMLRRTSPNPGDATFSLQSAFQESFDHAMCVFTSSEVSDDERMSLTAAASDEEEFAAAKVDQVHSYSAPGSVAFNCTGAVRKAGYLFVKKWILRKKHRVELARKRGWKGYWVCLKGTTLLFYPCESDEGRSIEQSPKHLIIVDGAIMQAIPEHPKREHIFCLSTAFGDAYLFQAGSESELNTWVSCIHTACAAVFARNRGKAGTLHLLQEEIIKMDRAIESESKLKYMAELQLGLEESGHRRDTAIAEMSGHEESLERLHCEQFRLRCYMSSLQGGELPNPKMLLARVSRGTKLRLSRLGVFAVSSLHAHVCARSPSLLQNLLAGRGVTKRRAPVTGAAGDPAESTAGATAATAAPLYMARSGECGTGPRRSYRVKLLGQMQVSVALGDGMTAEQFLNSACLRRNLQPSEHFLRLRKADSDCDDTGYIVPPRNDLIHQYLRTHEVCEVLAKQMFQTELTRPHLHQMWGFSVEADLLENENKQDELYCFISRVEHDSIAGTQGLISGDEILVINGAIVADLDMMYLESLLQEKLTLCVMVRTSRSQIPQPVDMRQSTDEMIERLVCPPPPQDSSCFMEQTVDDMIVPNIKSWEQSADEPPLKLKSNYATIGRTKVIHITEKSPKISIEKQNKTGLTKSPATSIQQVATGNNLYDGDKSCEEPRQDTTITANILATASPSSPSPPGPLASRDRSVLETNESHVDCEEKSPSACNKRDCQLERVNKQQAHDEPTPREKTHQLSPVNNQPTSNQQDTGKAEVHETTAADETPYFDNEIGCTSQEKLVEPCKEHESSNTIENGVSSTAERKTVVAESPFASAVELIPACQVDKPHPSDDCVELAEESTQSAAVADVKTKEITENLAAPTSGQSADRKCSLNDVDKLKLQLSEIITTERTYVQNLDSLMDNYLAPLRSENILTDHELDTLFGNIPHIISFQREFLERLERSLTGAHDSANFTSIAQFKDILLSVAETFIQYSLSFKLYSAFCTSHSRAQKFLHQNGGNSRLQNFLQRQNPGQQHCSTLDSYLITPIQRLLKYPLLLQQLRTIAGRQPPDVYRLGEALDAMEKIAEYINEVQRIHEEYGAVFDHLTRQYEKSCSTVLSMNSMVDLSPGELLHYGGVEWLNIADVLGKVKKGLDLHTMCFVFRTAVVIMCKERLKQRRRLMLPVSKPSSSEVEIVRYQALIPVTEVQVRLTSDKDPQPRHPWDLVHLKSQIYRRNERVYHLSNSEPEYRSVFLRSIRLIIRDSVRSMSVRVGKLPVSATRVNSILMTRTLSARRSSSSNIEAPAHSGLS